MTFKTMRYALTVAEEGSFSAAAKLLYLSQPSLSQSILALEKELGVTLFDRGTAPLTLTPAGERFVASARRMLALEAGLVAEMRAMSMQGRPMRVAAGPFRLQSLVADAHRRFAHLHPGVQVRLVEAWDDEVVRLTQTGQADLALVEGETPEGMVGYRVKSERVVLALARTSPAARELEDGARIPLERLSAESFVLPAPQLQLHELVQRMFGLGMLSPVALLETRSIDLMVSYARMGLAIAPVYESAVAAHRHELILLEPEEGSPRSTLYVCHRTGIDPLPSATEFIRLVRQQPVTLTD